VNEDAVETRRVTFYSDGIKLVGDIYLPPGRKPAEKRSGIVLCQGFATATGGRPYSSLPEFAQHFIRAGYVVLKFDYRGFGDSEGTRWRLIPLEQVADIRNALTFLQIQDEVEPTSVGLFGTSFGGSNVVYAAALDERVRCTVSNVPVGDGKRWLRKLREGWQWQALLRELDEDRKTRVLTGESRRVPRTHIQWSTDPEIQSRVKRIEEEEEFCNSLPLETAEAVIEYHPGDVVARISPRPILFLSVENDVLTPNEAAEELYEAAGEPKRWVVVRGVKSHYDVYLPPAFDVVAKEATDWFASYMPANAVARQTFVREALGAVSSESTSSSMKLTQTSHSSAATVAPAWSDPFPK
jgi:alpha-beta hydrolase superfamily lysophospholipase